MKPKLLGTFPLGRENVDLFVRDIDGGELTFQPGEKNRGQIVVGLDYPKWSMVVSTLLHETFEYAMHRSGCGYAEAYRLSTSGGEYLFVLNHMQFDEICERSAYFLVEALPPLADAYKKYGPKKK